MNKKWRGNWKCKRELTKPSEWLFCKSEKGMTFCFFPIELFSLETWITSRSNPHFIYPVTTFISALKTSLNFGWGRRGTGTTDGWLSLRLMHLLNMDVLMSHFIREPLFPLYQKQGMRLETLLRRSRPLEREIDPFLLCSKGLRPNL